MAMVAAAAVEWYRLKLYHQGKVLPALGHNKAESILSHHDGSGVVGMHMLWQVLQYLLEGVSEMNVFWQVFQYLLVGLNESGFCWCWHHSAFVTTTCSMLFCGFLNNPCVQVRGLRL